MVGAVAIANCAAVSPCAITTVAGIVATVELLASETLTPPAGAGAETYTVPL